MYVILVLVLCVPIIMHIVIIIMAGLLNHTLSPYLCDRGFLPSLPIAEVKGRTKETRIGQTGTVTPHCGLDAPVGGV